MIDLKENGFFLFQKSIQKKHGCFYQKVDLNLERHCVFLPQTLPNPVYYVIYKREYFMTFNRQFPEWATKNPDIRGVGESINQNYLEIAINKADYLAFVYQTGRIYMTTPRFFKRYAEKHKLIRRQEQTHEITYSIPIKTLERLK